MAAPAIRRILWQTGGQPSFFAPLANSLVPTIGSASPTFTRSTSKTYLNSQGLVATAASGVPAFNYDQAAGTPGLSIESTAQNIELWSGDATNAQWGNSNTTVTPAAATGPDGVAGSAQQVALAGSGTEGLLYDAATTSTGNYVGSLWVKGTPGQQVYLYVGQVSNAVPNATITFTGAWQRVSQSANLLTSGTNYVMLSTENRSAVTYLPAVTFDIWPGIQFETGTIASSYIPTTTGAVSRAADALSYPTAGMVQAAQGMVSIWVRNVPQDSGVRYAWDAAANGNTGLGLIARNGASGAQFFYGTGSTVIASTGYTGNLGDGAWHHLAASWGPSGGKFYVDDALFWTGSTPSGVVLAVNLNIGKLGASSSLLGGDIRNLGIYNRILSASEIAAIYAAGVH